MKNLGEKYVLYFVSIYFISLRYLTVFAFITGNRVAFRNRLKELNVEAKIRALYRPYFSNEIELERYIDQQFYDYTGYANRSEYEISEDGDLIRKMKPQNPNIKPPKPQGLFNFAKPSYPP